MNKTDAIARYCDRLLNVNQIQDYEGAVNGLQVENSGEVRQIGAVVDASMATLRLAADWGADLVVAHHGLFWGPRQPWTGRHYKLLRFLVEKDMAVYSAHLPLDLHPKLGNNAQLAAALGFKNLKPFFQSHGQAIGLQTKTSLPRQELVRRLEKAIGGRRIPNTQHTTRNLQPSTFNFQPSTRLIAGGPVRCRRIGIVTGGGGSELQRAAEEGVDTFITGEGPHWSFALAEELGLNVLYGGHYATETFGVKALAAHLARKFKLAWKFFDYPTGM